MKNSDILSDIKDDVEAIREEITVDLNELLILEDSLIVQFSALVNFIKTKMAAFQLIQFQKQQVDHFIHTGMIDEEERQKIIAKLDRRIVEINRYKPKNIEVVNFNSLALDFPLFGLLTSKELDYVVEIQAEEEYKKEGQVLSEGDQCEYFYLIKSGVVRETYTEGKTYRKTRGEMVNIASICNPRGLYLTTLTTLSNCKLIKVRKLILDDIMKTNKPFEEKCYQLSFVYYARYLESTNMSYRKIFQDVDDSMLDHIGRTSSFKELKKGDKTKLLKGGFIFSGALAYYLHDGKGRRITRIKYDQLNIVIPTESELEAVRDSKILIFDISVIEEDDYGQAVINGDSMSSSIFSVHRKRSSKKKKTDLLGMIADSYQTDQIFENSKHPYNNSDDNRSIGEKSQMILEEAERVNRRKRSKIKKKSMKILSNNKSFKSFYEDFEKPKELLENSYFEDEDDDASFQVEMDLFDQSHNKRRKNGLRSLKSLKKKWNEFHSPNNRRTKTRKKTCIDKLTSHTALIKLDEIPGEEINKVTSYPDLKIPSLEQLRTKRKKPISNFLAE